MTQANQTDVVIYTHCPNDFADDLRFLKGSYKEIRNALPLRRLFRENSVIYLQPKLKINTYIDSVETSRPTVEIEFQAVVCPLDSGNGKGYGVTTAHAISGIVEDHGKEPSQVHDFTWIVRGQATKRRPSHAIDIAGRVGFEKFKHSCRVEW